MGVDNKYGLVTLSDNTDIAENEPVFLFRAKDALVPKVLTYYAYLCERSNATEEHVKSIDYAREAIERWQQTHTTKVPGA
jgi:hypothetical protein